MEAVKPQEGTWEKMEGYPAKVKFEQGKSVVVTFADDFSGPSEMPSNDKNSVFYIFECMANGEKSSISTSSWTLLKSLKTHEPLAGKTLTITKRNVGGKNFFYVETPESFQQRIDATKNIPVDVSDIPEENLI